MVTQCSISHFRIKHRFKCFLIFYGVISQSRIWFKKKNPLFSFSGNKAKQKHPQICVLWWPPKSKALLRLQHTIYGDLQGATEARSCALPLRIWCATPHPWWNVRVKSSCTHSLSCQAPDKPLWYWECWLLYFGFWVRCLNSCGQHEFWINSCLSSITSSGFMYFFVIVYSVVLFSL